MKYVGIDVHKKMCQAAVLDKDGELLDEQRFPNTPEGIEKFAGKLSTFHDEVRPPSSPPATSGSRSTTGSRNTDSTWPYPIPPRHGSSRRRR